MFCFNTNLAWQYHRRTRRLLKASKLQALVYILPPTLLWNKDAGNPPLEERCRKAPLDERCQNLWREDAGNPPMEKRCRKPSFGGKVPESEAWSEEGSWHGQWFWPPPVWYRNGGEVTRQQLLLLSSYIFIFYQLHSVHYAWQYIFIVVLHCIVLLCCVTVITVSVLSDIVVNFYFIVLRCMTAPRVHSRVLQLSEQRHV